MASRPVHLGAVNSILLNIGDIHVPDVAGHDPEELRRARARAAFWLTLLFWGASFGLATLTIYLDGKPQWLAISLMRVLPMLLGFVASTWGLVPALLLVLGQPAMVLAGLAFWRVKDFGGSPRSRRP